MANWFAGIGQAASGLTAARYNLTVIGQNMTNVSTAGYTRQTTTQSAVETAPASGSTITLMDGVEVTSTDRATDIVLDNRVRAEHSRDSFASTTASQLSNVEAIFAEPSSTGIASQLDTFWNSWGSLSTATGTSVSAAQQGVLSDAASLASSLNTAASSLSDLASETSSSLANDVSTVNTATTALASLNGQIITATATGANANALLDQRDALLTTLSSTAGAKAQINADGSATVTVDGKTLVSGATAATMTVDSTNAVSVGGAAVSLTSGTMGARITALNTTFPQYQSALDSVAATLASTVNSAQTGGYDSNGDAGTAMFSGTTAADLKVVLTDPKTVVASSAANSADNSVASALSNAGTATGSADSLYRSFIGAMATASASAKTSASAQSSVTSYVDGLKSSMSGVSLDEEASNMLIQQQAFNASSRILTAIDSMLDTLINHTGVS